MRHRNKEPLVIDDPGKNKNPLYIEYYPHTDCDCYKIDLPWTKYRKHTLVLCVKAMGLARAKQMARKAIAQHLSQALAEPMPTGEKA